MNSVALNGRYIIVIQLKMRIVNFDQVAPRSSSLQSFADSQGHVKLWIFAKNDPCLNRNYLTMHGLLMHIPLSSPLMNNAREYLLLWQTVRSSNTRSMCVITRRGEFTRGNARRSSQES